MEVSRAGNRVSLEEFDTFPISNFQPFFSRSNRMYHKLDISRQKQVCTILAVGGTRKIAAQYVGCSERAIRNAAKRDAGFAEQLRRSETSPELDYLKTLDQAARDPKSWRATRWMLEHLYPERYTRKANQFGPSEVQAILRSFVDRLLSTMPKSSPERRDIRRRMVDLARSIVDDHAGMPRRLPRSTKRRSAKTNIQERKQ
jgi:hypothetical protein